MASGGGGGGGEWRPAVSLLVVNVALGVMNILVKKSLGEGLNSLVLITLRQLTATLFMAPIAYFKERKSRPKLTWWLCVEFFSSALLGASLTQYLFFLGLQYTSATFACAFLNMAPVCTFLIALPLRLERLNLKNRAGKAKLLATVVCISGVMVLMFYKGAAITNHSPPPATGGSGTIKGGGTLRWTLGSMALLAGCLCWSAWFLVQARIGKDYPAVYSSTTLMFFLSFLQAAVLTFATQRQGLSIWMLRGKLQIITVLYAGVVGSGVGFLVMAWCVAEKGPVFTVAFSPLIQIVVAIIDFTVLREPLLLGSVLGSLLVISGLYILLWGKSKEAKGQVKPVQEGDQKSSDQVEPPV